MESEPI